MLLKDWNSTLVVRSFPLVRGCPCSLTGSNRGIKCADISTHGCMCFIRFGPDAWTRDDFVESDGTLII